jgi:hypothetical protein
MNRRDSRDGSREDDLLVRVDHRLLGLAHPARQPSHAARPRKPLRLALAKQVGSRRLAAHGVQPLPHPLPHAFKPLVHCSASVDQDSRAPIENRHYPIVSI